MYIMDTNADGMLSWPELVSYFTVTGAMLSDEEFNLLLNDMTTRVEMQLLAASIDGWEDVSPLCKWRRDI